jgi:multidrug transporter EmrE-like cation transporter
MLTFVVALVIPAALTWRVEGAAVPFVIGSAALELAYFALLAAAYRRFELSLVYPVARGFAPVLALLLVVAVNGATPSAGGILGVLAVAVGVLLVRGARGSVGGLAVGAVIAATIAGYTVIDRYGVAHAGDRALPDAGARGARTGLLGGPGPSSGTARASTVDRAARSDSGVRLPARPARASACQCAGRGRCA